MRRGQKRKLQLKRAAGQRVRNQGDQSVLASPRWAFHLHFFQKHPAQSVLYCESIPQGRHSSFLSNLADKTGISHSYQNKGESSQSDRSVFCWHSLFTALPLPNYQHHCFSSAGLSDVHGPVWNEGHSNKYSAPGVHGGNIMSSFKVEYPGFLSAQLLSHGCCDAVVFFGTELLTCISARFIVPW